MTAWEISIWEALLHQIGVMRVWSVQERVGTDHEQKELKMTREG